MPYARRDDLTAALIRGIYEGFAMELEGPDGEALERFLGVALTD